MGYYQQIDHTADLALRVTGKNLEDLFRTASEGWRQLVVGNFDPKSSEQRKMELKAESLEELLVECLSELNYLLMGKHWLFNRYMKLKIRIDKSAFILNALFEGENFSENDHPIENEIKAVTFHQLQIREGPQGYETTIVFDI